MKLATTLLLASISATPLHAQTPNLGPNVLLITPATPQAEAQQAINTIYATQQHNEFGPERNAILFAPGTYHLDIPIGFYTQVLGLGANPDATHILGNVHVDATLPHNNATCTFWRGAENFSITPTGGNMQWAVSQAIPMRRMHILGDLTLHQQHGWASGGWLSDSLIDGTIDSGPQQQWISRNSQWKSWTGANWNMVFVGDPHAPSSTWPKPANTTIAQTPIIREKPFLFIDSTKHWQVHVPELQHNTTGTTWQQHPTPGTNIPLTNFYIATPADTAQTLNTQLQRGKHLLFTPGIYALTEPLHITHANTLLLGLGFATLQPTQGTAAILTDDVDNLTLAGLLIDAGPTQSSTLVQIGEPTQHHSHTTKPTALFDIFFRIGGAGPGRTHSNLTINSNDTLVDHTWIWRADHGHNVGWTDNLSDNGLIVEHHQQYQVLWNGNAGRTFFYQSEIPYDPPTQSAYTSAPQTNGWASYKVSPNVTQHEAFGLGIYSVFRHPDIFVTSAIEAPLTPNVRFHDIITVCLDTNGGIQNVVNHTGGSTSCRPRFTPQLTLFHTTDLSKH
ncbi:MAG: coagulation factor 5/8 type domain-containing protein [Acidobacteriota bacterium]